MAMAPAPDHILEIRDLRTHFFTDKGVVRAVAGVNLDLARKTTLGIVGESGCGEEEPLLRTLRGGDRPLPLLGRITRRLPL